MPLELAEINYNPGQVRAVRSGRGKKICAGAAPSTKALDMAIAKV